MYVNNFNVKEGKWKNEKVKNNCYNIRNKFILRLVKPKLSLTFSNAEYALVYEQIFISVHYFSASINLIYFHFFMKIYYFKKCDSFVAKRGRRGKAFSMRDKIKKEGKRRSKRNYKLLLR